MYYAFFKDPTSPKFQTSTIRELGCFKTVSHLLRALNDHSIKNSATTSPSLFLPIELNETVRASLVAIASSTCRLIWEPCSQMKVVIPVALFL